MVFDCIETESAQVLRARLEAIAKAVEPYGITKSGGFVNSLRSVVGKDGREERIDLLNSYGDVLTSIRVKWIPEGSPASVAYNVERP